MAPQHQKLVKMDEQMLSVLEQRVAAIEKEVFGVPAIKPENKDTSIAEALLNAHTMITSALSCRDSVVKVLERLHQLNDYMDPTYPDNEMEIEAKKEYIVQLYPELKQVAKMLDQLNKLKQFVDSDNIAKVPELSQRLDKIVSVNVDTYMISSQNTKDVLETINKYNNIITTLEVLIMQFEQNASEIEAELAPKPPSMRD